MGISVIGRLLRGRFVVVVVFRDGVRGSWDRFVLFVFVGIFVAGGLG